MRITQSCGWKETAMSCDVNGNKTVDLLGHLLQMGFFHISLYLDSLRNHHCLVPFAKDEHFTYPPRDLTSANDTKAVLCEDWQV
jgi:hypothetical protein